MSVARGALVGVISWLLTSVALPSASTTTADAAVDDDCVSRATAYHINVRRNGWARCERTLAPPLTERWSRDFEGGVSYPLIAEGKVFVTVRRPEYGTTLYALSARTGRTVWSRVTRGWHWSAAAYWSGRIFVLDLGGTIAAYRSRGGRELWKREIRGQTSYDSLPVVAGGKVFLTGAGDGSTAYAISARTGRNVWTRAMQSGTSGPALSADTVFVDLPCPQTYAFARRTGRMRWHRNGGCSGGGVAVPVLHAGRLYAHDGSLVLDADNGRVIERLSPGPPPAFGRNQGFFHYGEFFGGGLHALRLSDYEERWRFEGDGRLSTAPIYANGHVYIGSTSGTIYALDGTDGDLVWSDDTGAPIYGDIRDGSAPWSGLAAAGGILAVPSNDVLTVYD